MHNWLEYTEKHNNFFEHLSGAGEFALTFAVAVTLVSITCFLRALHFTHQREAFYATSGATAVAATGFYAVAFANWRAHYGYLVDGITIHREPVVGWYILIAIIVVGVVAATNALTRANRRSKIRERRLGRIK